MHDRPHRASRRHADLGAFGAERLEIDHLVVFDVEPVADRLDRGHAAQHLERHLDRPLLIGQHDGFLHHVAGGLFRAGEHAAEHHGVAAEEQGLEDGAVPLDPAIGDERQVVARGLAAFDQRLQLRHAETGRQPRGASTTGPDPHLDGVHAAFGEKADAVGRGHVAGHQLDVGKLLLEGVDRTGHDHGMAVSDVDHDDVDLRLDQLRGPLEEVAGRADGRAHAQAAVRIAGGEGEPFLPIDVFRGDQPQQRAVGVHERQLLDLLLDHQALGDVERQLAMAHDELACRRHARRHRAFTRVHEPHVAFGQQALEPPRRVDHHQRARPCAPHHGHGFFQARLGRHGVRVADDDVLHPLDLLDLAHLRLDVAVAEPAVDDAEAAFFGLDDGHRRARDRIHVGRHERPLEGDAGREPARQVHHRRVAPLDHAVLRAQQEVVEGRAADQFHEGIEA